MRDVKDSVTAMWIVFGGIAAMIVGLFAFGAIVGFD
jgi:hypothetical protein